MRRGAAVAAPARRATGYESRCEAAASLPRRAAAASLPCRAATVEPLPPVNSTCRQDFILLSSKEMFALKLHVASVCFKCFKCFRGMLQVSRTDVAKVDLDVAHVAMVVHVCCKLPFSMLHLFFPTYVASVFI